MGKMQSACNLVDSPPLCMSNKIVNCYFPLYIPNPMQSKRQKFERCVVPCFQVFRIGQQDLRPPHSSSAGKAKALIVANPSLVTGGQISTASQVLSIRTRPNAVGMSALDLPTSNS